MKKLHECGPNALSYQTSDPVGEAGGTNARAIRSASSARVFATTASRESHRDRSPRHVVGTVNIQMLESSPTRMSPCFLVITCAVVPSRPGLALHAPSLPPTTNYSQVVLRRWSDGGMPPYRLVLDLSTGGFCGGPINPPLLFTCLRSTE
ncbi:hypothetical protein BO71DRAFT_254945 [Aspergillus ellipticus CBS 707.79]|uniref:Uncharacterized protein n=1 Tax=Aspergillus ellipticus CBS 707.79 TaxID=1448320 RepID=A0A319ERF4_9EURO|nr:hypothetical protein BO71DRAFT_254945 [Aspergillus ellipticus CBS 707.79]